MKPTPAIAELAISIVAKNLNPTLLTADFLQYSGIVPSHWQLASAPILNAKLAYVAYSNGINISIQSGTITFSENIFSENSQAKALESVAIPTLARQYAKTLPNASYQSAAIKPKSFFTFDDAGDDAARNYINRTLLAPGGWQEIDSYPVAATLSLAYTLKRGLFNLKVEQVQLRLGGKPSQAAILFSGSFPYRIAGDTPSQRQELLWRILDNWRSDLETYREIIYERFLGQASNGLYPQV